MNTFALAAQAGNGAGSQLFMIIILVVLFGFTYFTMIKPQKKQQQERQEMMNKLQKGDQVEMVDGLHGKIDSINDEDKTVVLDADGIYLTFSRLAVRTVLKKASAEDAKPAAEKADEAEKPAEADGQEADSTDEK
ncbi:MAG: preprotein translocase subunit YajC [Lacticaseibacillus absianus]|uniref:preprotein translocase subunit YajC n=1 Tax=uncultured Lactobacillus sp. TaxID=153152 RepID=UPI001A8D1C23|nr:preprotein translocase subunit YajC [uncultured Lactobacillus sp.]